MANRGGYEKRRQALKKERERKLRKRRQRNRRIAQALILLTVLALLFGVTFAIVSGGDDEGNLASENAGCDVAGAKQPNKQPPGKKPAMQIDTKKTYTATMVTSCGTLRVELFDNKAPETVNNFVALARQKFYDGTIFHRVIPDFGGPQSDMVQGGDATQSNGSGDPGYRFGDENLIPFDKPGYLAMANSGPGTNGSQFFIMSGTVAHLNVPKTCPAPKGKQASCHSIFGQVTEGLDVVSRIGDVKRENDKPVKDVVLISVTIEEK